MTEVTITLPLPPSELSPNASNRMHWRKKSRAVRTYRRDALLITLSWCGSFQGWPAAVAQATFFFATRRRRDADNFAAMLKPAFDGIVAAGLICNDSFEHLTHEKPVFDFDPKNPRVEIRLRRVEKGDSDA